MFDHAVGVFVGAGAGQAVMFGADMGMMRNAMAPALARLEAQGLVVCACRRMTVPSLRQNRAFLDAQSGMGFAPAAG